MHAHTDYRNVIKIKNLYANPFVILESKIIDRFSYISLNSKQIYPILDVTPDAVWR